MLFLLLSVYMVLGTLSASSRITNGRKDFKGIKTFLSGILLFISGLHVSTAMAWPSRQQKVTVEYASRNRLSPAEEEQVKTLKPFTEELLSKHIPSYLAPRLEPITVRYVIYDALPFDEMFRPDRAKENEFLIEIKRSFLTSPDFKPITAHELFHGVHYMIHPDEPTWVREGLAQVFEWMTSGRKSSAHLRAGFENLNYPLEVSFDDYAPTELAPMYGHSFLYFYYLYQHCGGEKLFWKIAQGISAETFDRVNIDTVLKIFNFPAPECQSFADSAIHFEVARIHNKEQFVSSPNSKSFFVYGGAFGVSQGKIPVLQKADHLILKDLPDFKPTVLSNYLALPADAYTDAYRVYHLENAFPFAVSRVFAPLLHPKPGVLVLIKYTP